MMDGARPLIPPRPASHSHNLAPSFNRTASAVARLQYPRLATCDVAFYAGPTMSHSSGAPSSGPIAMPALSSSASASADIASNFHLESAAQRTLASVRSSWDEEASGRAKRRLEREAAEELRLQREAEAALAAQKAREQAERERRAAEAARAAAEARAAEEARLARLKAEEEARLARQRAEEEEARDRAEAEKLAAEEAKIRERKEELERKQRERAFASGAGAALPIAHPVAAQASVASPHSAAAAGVASTPTASQLAFERSFQELTGIQQTAQIRTLLAALNYDLDRAIAIFFADNPPSMPAALEKARSIQMNAQQQQQQQQQHAVSPANHQQAQPSPAQYQPYSQPQQQAYPYQQQAQVQPAAQQQQMTRIQVIMPDGRGMYVDCLASDTLWTLYERLSPALAAQPAWANKSIRFVLVQYPHTRYDETKFDCAMHEAGLVPTGSLRIELSN